MEQQLIVVKKSPLISLNYRYFLKEIMVKKIIMMGLKPGAVFVHYLKKQRIARVKAGGILSVHVLLRSAPIHPLFHHRFVK
jgi:hypothetical protein